MTTITADYEMVQERNRTSVTSATQACGALHSNVDIQQTLMVTARERVGAADRHVGNTNTELTRLMADLSTIRQLDSVGIEELRGRVRAAQADLDGRHLITIAQNLQRIVNEQRTRLDEMQTQKFVLEDKIHHLRTIQGQLRAESP